MSRPLYAQGVIPLNRMSGGFQSQPEPGGKKKNRFPCHELKPSHPVHRQSLY
jgi:hypothetical protein